MTEVSITARILVAEDDVIVARDIQESLAGLGYEVPRLVHNGDDAVDAARELDVDLVLMDIRMPGSIDGVEAARQIGTDFGPPVVFLTAYSDDRTVSRAKETGPFGYLVKPFDQRELKTTVELAIFRHHLETMLRDSRERYRQLFEDDLAAHYAATPEGKVLAANQAFADLLDADSVDEVLDLPAPIFYPSAFRHQHLVEEIRERGFIRTRRGRILRMSGRSVPVLNNARGVFDDDGALREIHWNLIDMSRERKLEEQLRRSARMEAVGRLAGGVAHNFNNLLTSIRGTVDLVLTEDALSEQTRDDLESVLGTCDRATRLVEGLLAAGGKGREAPRETVDMNALVEETTETLTRLLGAGQELRVSAAPSALRVRGFRPQLEQVLINLVLNAKEAMSGGGEIAVELEEVSPGDDVVAARPNAPHGWVRLSVSDTGTGMNAKTLEQIFDPFFTTRERGTGLGLSTVYEIVRRHGGDVDVKSEPGRGTTFTIYLPRTPEQVETGDAPERGEVA